MHNHTACIWNKGVIGNSLSKLTWPSSQEFQKCKFWTTGSSWAPFQHPTEIQSFALNLSFLVNALCQFEGVGVKRNSTQLMVNCWFGLVVWIPGIPLWKGLLLGCTPRIPNHRAPNQQLTISWSTGGGGGKTLENSLCGCIIFTAAWMCFWSWEVLRFSAALSVRFKIRVPTALQNWDYVWYSRIFRHLGVNNLSHSQVPSRNNKIPAWQKISEKMHRKSENRWIFLAEFGSFLGSSVGLRSLELNEIPISFFS